MNRDLLARHLENQGHNVAQAKNGRQTLEIIRKDRFDMDKAVFLMDEDAAGKVAYCERFFYGDQPF